MLGMQQSMVDQDMERPLCASPHSFRSPSWYWIGPVGLNGIIDMLLMTLSQWLFHRSGISNLAVNPNGEEGAFATTQGGLYTFSLRASHSYCKPAPVLTQHEALPIRSLRWNTKANQLYAAIGSSIAVFKRISLWEDCIAMSSSHIWRGLNCSHAKTADIAVQKHGLKKPFMSGLCWILIRVYPGGSNYLADLIGIVWFSDIVLLQI